MKMEPLIRVVFKEGVNFPGRNAGIVLGEGSSIETVFPKRGAIGSVRDPHEAFFCEGFVMLRHPASQNSIRVPMHMVKELAFASDNPKAPEKKA